MKRLIVRGRTRACLAILLAPLLHGGSARAEDKYPSRPIEFIVPWGPGGGADQVARKLGKLIEPQLKVSLPVINVPGATGNSGMAKMLAAPADGYSLQVVIGDTFAQLATSKPRWKLEDLAPVGIVIRQPSAFMVAEGSRFKSWADVEREAKGGVLKVGVTGFGSVDDVTVNFFAARGVKLVSVPFANPGERYTALLGGHTDLLYEQLGDVRSYLDNKQMRPVIVFAEKRFPAFKEAPSSVELGYPIILPQFRAIVMKSGTDARRVKLIADAIAKACASAEYKSYLQEQYADENSCIAAADAAAFFQNELKALKRVGVMTAAPEKK